MPTSFDEGSLTCYIDWFVLPQMLPIVWVLPRFPVFVPDSSICRQFCSSGSRWPWINEDNAQVAFDSSFAGGPEAQIQSTLNLGSPLTLGCFTKFPSSSPGPNPRHCLNINQYSPYEPPPPLPAKQHLAWLISCLAQNTPEWPARVSDLKNHLWSGQPEKAIQLVKVKMAWI